MRVTAYVSIRACVINHTCIDFTVPQVLSWVGQNLMRTYCNELIAEYLYLPTQMHSIREPVILSARDTIEFQEMSMGVRPYIVRLLGKHTVFQK
jgi:hypothetical protein